MVAILAWLLLATPPPPVPWEVGQEAAPGWTVTALERQVEFVRLSVEGPDGATTLEVVPATAPPGPFDSARYTVQAAPGAQPPLPLVRRVVGELRAFESRPGHRPFVMVAHKQPWRPPGGQPWSLRGWLDSQPFPAGLLLLGVAALLGLASSLLWLRARPAPGTLPFLVVGLSLVAAFAWTVSPRDLPIDLFTPMHEGGTWRNVQRLYAEGIHSGPLHRTIRALVRDGAGSLRNLVHLNLVLEAAATVGVVAIARSALRTWPRAALAGLAWATQLPVLHAATSELPSALLHVVAVLAFPAAALLALPGRSRATRALALVQLLICAVLAVTTRRELVTLALALPVAVVLAAGRRDLITRAHSALGRTLRTLLSRPLSAGKVAIWVLLFSSVLIELLRLGLVEPLTGASFRVWVGLAGVSPINPTALAMPFITVRLVTPGLVLLSLVGVAVVVRRRPELLPLAVVALILWRTHNEAAHGTSLPEHLRYATYAWPLIALFALLGWKAVEAFISRHVARPRLVGLVVALACLVPVAPLQRGGESPLPHDRASLALMNRDLQAEQRMMVEAVEHYPTCTLVTRVVTVEEVSDPKPHPIAWVAFGGALSSPRILAEGPVSPRFADLRRQAGSRCVLYFQGLDCNRRWLQRCDPGREGLEPVAERSFAAPHYTEIEHSGGYASLLHLGLWAAPAMPLPLATGDRLW